MMEFSALGTAAREFGADLCGVAPVERFAELPPEQHPASIFPETRSVIVLGRRIPRGALRGAEEGTNFTNYHLYGDLLLDNHFVSLVTYRVGEFLEDQGWEAVPLPNLPPEIPPLGLSVGAGRVRPNVLLDVAEAAVRAGVGEIGYCGHLLTPRFGPRQRLQLLLTDAEIEPTELLTPTLCPGPEECPAACPLGALSGGREVSLAGKRMTLAEVAWDTCRSCPNGARPNRHHPAGKPDRLAAYCGRTCADFLERTGRVSNHFAAPLRVREPWTAERSADLFRL